MAELIPPVVMALRTKALKETDVGGAVKRFGGECTHELSQSGTDTRQPAATDYLVGLVMSNVPSGPTPRSQDSRVRCHRFTEGNLHAICTPQRELCEACDAYKHQLDGNFSFKSPWSK